MKIDKTQTNRERKAKFATLLIELRGILTDAVNKGDAVPNRKRVSYIVEWLGVNNDICATTPDMWKEAEKQIIRAARRA